jgi:hypothetical protein
MNKKELKNRLLIMEKVNGALADALRDKERSVDYQRRLRKNEKRILVKNIHRAKNGQEPLELH